MWLMESADPEESQPERLAIRILVINIATIHTTAAVRILISEPLFLHLDNHPSPSSMLSTTF